jgi:hypothetical protein
MRHPVPRRLSGQHGELVHRHLDLRPDRGGLRHGAAHIAFVSRHIGQRRHARAMALPHKAQRLFAQGDDLRHHYRAVLCIAQVHIGLRHLRRKADLRIGQLRLGPILIGAGVFIGALVDAPEIRLPRGRRAKVVDFERTAASPALNAGRSALPAMNVGATEGRSLAFFWRSTARLRARGPVHPRHWGCGPKPR